MAAAGVEVEETRASRWRRSAMVGQLSPDFLRISTPMQVHEVTRNLHEGYPAIMDMREGHGLMPYYAPPKHIGRLSITCAQARLARNYGLTRMDPYVRIRVGHYVYETQTDPNGGKNPRWNRVIQSQVAVGVNSIFVEIYDECSFKMDELIAWCEIKIPDNVISGGETHEEWYRLSGKQGDGMEGDIDIVLSFSSQPVQSFVYQPMPAAPGHMLMVPPGRPMPIFVTPQQPPAPTVRPIVPLSEEDFKQIQEMFPNIDKEVIKSVSDANRCNKDATINSLLQMNE